MYNLGESFKFDLNKSMPNPESVIKGDKYRITVLTERLVRLEYNENGMFVDNPTKLIWYRNFEKPKFRFDQTSEYIKITTKYFELIYRKEKNFQGSKFNPTSNLKISLRNTDKVWYYNHPEIKNFGTCGSELNDKKFIKGLFSLDGFTTIDDSDSYVFMANGNLQNRSHNGIDIYVFLYNTDFYYCLNDYFELTGYPSLLPRYALGTWWCKSDFYSEKDISHVINKFEDKNIPISVFMFDNWQENNSFSFKNEYTDPKMTINFLKSKNIKCGLVLDDVKYFNSNTLNYDKLKEYLPLDKKGNIPFNVFDPKSLDAYLKLLIHPITSLGIDFYFFNKYDKKEIDRNFVYQHFLYKDNFLKNNNRNLVCCYNSLIAPHRYPVLYSGKNNVNWDTLKNIIKYNILACNNGVSYVSHDFGGTSEGVEDSELFIRFIQLGTFSPILRLGADNGKYYKREPWKWDLSTSSITSQFLRLRYKLIPYIYTEMYKYYKYGKPIIEPLYYKYISLYDDVLYNDQYFFGSHMLICPIFNKKDPVMNRVIHKIFIPDGVWYEYFSGKKFSGNKKYVTFYKEEEYPVFVKAGTIIPLSLNYYNDVDVPKKMELEIFPGASNTYSIYEDDGITNNYKDCNYLITNVEFIYNKDNYRLTILPTAGKSGIIHKNRDYKIRFRNTHPVSKVYAYVNNKQIESKCYKEGLDFIVEVENIPTDLQFTLMCIGENIQIDEIKIINEDIVSIISDLPIKTVVKQKIDSIMFSKELSISKKRIEIRKLANGKNWIERKYIDLFLKLLEYIKEV